jgi:glycosyltransferase involved in cell wall biosynthesis
VSSPRRRALLITPDYRPMTGGIARLLAGLVDSTAEHVDWRVLTSAKGAEGGEVVAVPSLAAMVAKIPDQAGWLRCAQERLVVCGHVYAAPLAVVAGRLSRTPVGTIAYGMELVPRRPRHRAALSALRLSERVVAISEHTGTVVRALGLSADRTRVVNPVLKPLFQPGGEPLGRTTEDGLRLVAVSRLAEGYKNIELILRLVSVLAKSAVVSRLTIVGDGPRRSVLEKKVSSLGIGELVHFAGQVDDSKLVTLLRESDLGLFPSRDSLAEGAFEGFGLVVQEMASAGLPVLVGRAAGALDAARPEWSVLLDPDDLRAWTRAVAEFAGDEPSRLRMAESAIDWARAVDHRKIAHQFLDALAP